MKLELAVSDYKGKSIVAEGGQEHPTTRHWLRKPRQEVSDRCVLPWSGAEL